MAEDTPAGHAEASQSWSLADFYSNNGAAWGGADLFLIGDRDVLDHTAQFLTALKFIRLPDGKPAFQTIVIVVPPFEKPPAEFLTALKDIFPDAVRRLRGHPASQDEVVAAFSNVLCKRCADMDVRSPAALVLEMRPKSAAIITHGALYRAAEVQPRVLSPPVPDDIWAPHLRVLGEAIEVAAVDADGYVVVHGGVFIPSREANYELLETCKWGVAGMDAPGRSDLAIIEQAERWHGLINEGRLGTIMSEIDAIDGLSDIARSLMKLQTFASAGLVLEVRSALERQPELTAGLDPAGQLKVAILAEQSGAEAMAADLLSSASEQLHSQEALEDALDLAVRLRNEPLIRLFDDKLTRMFSASTRLRSHRLSKLIGARDYAAAATLFKDVRSADGRSDFEYFSELASTLGGAGEPDIPAVVSVLSGRFPEHQQETLLASARHLEAFGQRGAAIMLLSENSAGGGDDEHRQLALAITMLERGRLLLDEQVDNRLALKVIEWLARELARLPHDAAMRHRLAHLVSPEVLGSNGLPMIAAVVLALFRRPFTPRSVTPLDRRPKASKPDDLWQLIERGMIWLAKERPIVIGRRVFPAEMMNVPADEALTGLQSLTEHIGRNSESTSVVQMIEACVAIAAAIAPLATERNGDLLVLRLAAGHLTVAGRAQRARDLVEQGLSMAGEDAQRRRLAWFAFADVYARLGNLGEALIGLACCAVADPRATWDQVWYETQLLMRIFRDLGMLPLARPLLEPARRALAEMRAPQQYAFRIDTMELQIRLLETDIDGKLEVATVKTLLTDLERNVRQVLQARDEIEPAAVLLANGIRLAGEQGLPHSESASSALDAAMACVSQTSRAWIEATAAARPSIDQLLPLVRRLEAARYAEDVAYDVRNIVIAAKRALGGGETLSAADAIYATELLTDQAISLPAAGRNSHFLGVNPDAPAAAAQSLSMHDISVVTLACSQSGLVRTVAMHGVLSGPFSEPTETFSEKRLIEWTVSYPYGYRQVADVNEFYLSTSGIGLTEIADRSVVVSDAAMQAYPPNLLAVGDDLAGRTRRLASAPSLAWLKGAVECERISDGRMTAWIPDAAPEGGLSTLGMIADRLRESFDRYGVVVTSGNAPPAGLAGSDMAIVAAHGGLAEDARFFRVVTDDVALAIASSTLSGALANIGVVVLFVCSGGRLDKHPGASTTVGLAKRLLDNGCNAVIAPPWPLDVSVPPHWLPVFLAEWSNGACVIDACFTANEAVRASLGDDPAKYLAMSVHGNPLARRQVR